MIDSATLMLLSACVFPAVGLICCCDAVVICEVFQDAFTRANSTNVGSDWTEAAGDWSITSNRVRVSSANAVLVGNTANPNGTAAMSLQVTPVATYSTGDKVRLMLDYVDVDNYLYAEIVFDPGFTGVGRWVIGRRAGGVDHELDEYPDTTGGTGGETYRFCIDEDLTSCSLFIDLANPDRLTVGGITTSSDLFAIGTGDTLAGNADFDSVVVNATVDGCTTCEPILCQRSGDPLCDPATGRPEQVQLEISGVANNASSTCTTGCTGNPPNGTFILDLDPKRTAGSPCSYFVATSAFCTGRNYDYILVQIGASGAGGQRKIRAHFCQNLSCTAGGTSFEYEFTGTALVDCMALDVFLTGVAGGSCDLSGATCRLTSL